VAIDEKELPLELPELEDFRPTDTGESPLAKAGEWLETVCPRCGEPAKRETDTMPQWAGSSWYFLRYIDPFNDKAFASKGAMNYWMSVDWYNGGMEHTTLHLLYSRFWHKFLYDRGYVNTPEPYQKRTSHGMILGENNEKMSKSRGNIINPDEIVSTLGADTLRTYIMFIGAFDQSAAWSNQGVKGCRRFLDRVWKLMEIVNNDERISERFERSVNYAIKKVGEDFERMKFNTAIAALMSLVNEFYSAPSITKGDLKAFIALLSPVAPHICEEMWQLIGGGGHLYNCAWPEYDESKLVEDVVELAVQINGKVRCRINVRNEASEDEIRDAVLSDWGVLPYLEGREIKKIIIIKNRLVNMVVG